MNNETMYNAPPSDAEKQKRKVQLFSVGPRRFGVFENEVGTIVQWREPTPLPHAPESVLGVVSIQGRMLTVLDPALLTDGGAVLTDARYRFIIALSGDEQLSLAVSSVDETIEHSNSDAANSTDNNEKFVSAVLLRAGHPTKILKVTELFPAALQGRERRRRRF